MKGRVILLDRIDGRSGAALIVDGRLQDVLIDPPENAAPAPGAIFRAKADRPMKGQGGITVKLPNGRGFLKQSKGISPGQTILVQVSGVAEAGKAAPVTSRLLFKSRYAIVTPDAPGLNISRTIKDEAERDRLLEIAHAAMNGAPEAHGLILRSAAAEVDGDAVAADITDMRDLAAQVTEDLSGPVECLLDAPDAHDQAWRDWSVPDPDEVIEAKGCFDGYGVHEAVAEMLSPVLPLASQASAMVEPTRALVAIDVNTGGDTSLAAGLKANMALARELPRALRIKGLGGQVVVDLAPMPKKDRRQWEATLRRAFKEDGADVVYAGWTPLGHFEMQKRRDRFPLSEIWPA